MRCVGARSRCEYALYGDAVNVAARLATHESNADQILVCEHTARACVGRATFDEGEGLRLKGKRGRVRAFRIRTSDTSGDDTGGGTIRDGDETRAAREEDARRAIIHALSPPARRAAMRAATLGPAFDEELFLAAVKGDDSETGHASSETGHASSAAELVREGILTRSSGRDSLAFADEGLRRVAYGMLSDAARRPAHAAAGAALASRMGIDETEKEEEEEEEECEEEEREAREKRVTIRARVRPRALRARATLMRAGEDARALRCLDLATAAAG